MKVYVASYEERVYLYDILVGVFLYRKDAEEALKEALENDSAGFTLCSSINEAEIKGHFGMVCPKCGEELYK